MNIGKYTQMYSEDLQFANYAENTIKNYAAQVELFLKYFNNTATKTAKQRKFTRMFQIICSIKFGYLFKVYI